MKKQLDQKAKKRFIQIAGMIGSNHDGERLAATVKANAILAEHGLTWAEILQEGGGTRYISSHEYNLQRQRAERVERENRILRAKVLDLERIVAARRKRSSAAASIQETCDQIIANMELSEREEDFIKNVRGRHRLTEKQEAWLRSLAEHAGLEINWGEHSS